MPQQNSSSSPYNYPDNFLYSALLLLLLLFNAITRRYLLADIVALSRVHTSLHDDSQLIWATSPHVTVQLRLLLISGVSRLRDRSILLKIFTKWKWPTYMIPGEIFRTINISSRVMTWLRYSLLVYLLKFQTRKCNGCHYNTNLATFKSHPPGYTLAFLLLFCGFSHRNFLLLNNKNTMMRTAHNLYKETFFERVCC